MERISTTKDSKMDRSFFVRGEQSKPLFFQPKLTVSHTNDVYEREADAVAHKVMRMSATEQGLTKSSAINLQPGCAGCEEVDPLSRKEHAHGLEQLEAPSIVSDALGSVGMPLDDNTRSFMQNRFGYDFSKVKVHTDSVAAKSAQSINALAYTNGNNIVFNENQYAPHTEKGKKLLAHELTHTLQQNENHLIQKQDKPVAHTNKNTKTTTYQFLGKWYEQKHFDFFANAAYNTMVACLNEGFSMAGALFVIALATTESGWGVGNGGEAYHNLFSIMGGEKGDLGTAHGTLRKFSTYEAGFNEGFIKRIVDGVDAAGKAKFPNIRPVLSKPDFTMDEVNEAFGQAAYYNPGKRYSYEADGRLTWAAKYFKDVKDTTIPFMRNELRNRWDSMVQLNKMIPEEDQVQMLPEIINLGKWQDLLGIAQLHFANQLNILTK